MVMEFSIRDVAIRPGLPLAPMEGVTDITFRRLVRNIGGCGLTTTEFIPAHGLHYNVKRAREMAQFDEDERPVSVQVYGRDPAMLAKAAAIVQVVHFSISFSSFAVRFGQEFFFRHRSL